MTVREYLEQNKAGFENDSFAREKFKHIIESNGIKTVIETGTYLGSTTKVISKWVDKVHSIEIKPDHFNKAKEVLKNYSNVKMWQGNSASGIGIIMRETEPEQPLFFFLDAHWEEYNPLLDELASIKAHDLKPFIAIHDFKVPGHPELGFDSYKGQDYDWDWIKDSVEAIYGKDGFEVEYNSDATGAKRGIIYLSPKKALPVYNVVEGGEITHINLVEESPYGKEGNFIVTE